MFSFFRHGPLARGLHRLDLLPSWAAWSIGLACGALAGGALTGGLVPRALGAVAFAGLLGLGWAVAWSGEPVAVLEPAPQPTQEPAPLPAPGLYTSRFLDLVSIPGGTLLMGSPKGEEGRYDNEGPVHPVRISPFACARHPVTRRLYAEISGADPGWPEGEADERPVNNVSWRDAVAFCNQLSEREGVHPCYRLAGEVVTWDLSANGYRLLTEAEWEYACRAGSTSRYSFGDDEGELGEHAWFGENSENRPHPVGEKRPNAWGLHDLHGNIWEWCWDWYGSYSEAPESDPAGPQEGSGRVLRGGAFDGSPRNLRSAFRFRFEPSIRFKFIGFRCARGPRRQP